MSTYVGAEQVMCDIWVRERIQTVAADLNAVAEGLSGRVYQDFAPKSAQWPVIIYQCQDPPRDVRGVGVSSVMVDTLYLVKAVAQGENYDDLAPIAKALHGAMTTSTGSAVGDGSVLTSVREDQFSMVEIDEGEQFRHLGGVYRIQAQG
jgi:hypothetical protein